MEKNYKLDKIEELAGGDEEFIASIAEAFLEEVPEAILLMKEGLVNKNFKQVYQNAHKIKPTVEMFGLPIYQEVIVLQDWGKFEQLGTDVINEYNKISELVSKVVAELKSDFNL